MDLNVLIILILVAITLVVGLLVLLAYVFCSQHLRKLCPSFFTDSSVPWENATPRRPPNRFAQSYQPNAAPLNHQTSYRDVLRIPAQSRQQPQRPTTIRQQSSQVNVNVQTHTRRQRGSTPRRNWIRFDNDYDQPQTVIEPSSSQSSDNLNFVHSIDEQVRQAKKAEDIIKLKKMREIQADLLKLGVMTADQLGYKLLIAVDATPTRIGGYCVRLKDTLCHKESSWAEMYTFKSEKLPWILNDQSVRGDSEEFEMKNLLFALLLWEEEIIDAVEFGIFTDNRAVRDCHSEYGKRVQGFLRHLDHCCGVRLTNPNKVHLNSKRDEKKFARFIQPADDLSRWEISEAENFVCKAYDVKISVRSHKLPTTNREVRSYHPKADGYREMLQKVKKAVNEWRKPCPTCHFSIEDTGSLESITISIR